MVIHAKRVIHCALAGLLFICCALFAGMWAMHQCMQHPPIPTDDQDVRQVLNGHTDSLSQLSFLTKDTRLVSGSWDGTVKLWDLHSGREICTLNGHQYRVYALALCPRPPLLAVGDHNGKVVLWDLTHFQETATMTQSASIQALAFYPNRDDVLVAVDDLPQSLISWNYHTLTQHNTPGEGGNVVSATMPSGNVIISSREDGTVTIWDGSLTTRIQTMRRDGGGPALLSVASQKSRFLAFWPVDHYGVVWDLDTHTKVCEFKSSLMNTVSSACLSPSGKWVILTGCVWAYEPGVIQIINANSGYCCRTLRAHRSIAYSAAVSHDERLMATGGGLDHSIKIWSLQDLVAEFNHGD